MTATKRFLKTLAAGATALAVMTAAAAAPARADEQSDNIAKVLAGLAFLAILAEAADKDDDKRREPVAPQTHDRDRDREYDRIRPGSPHDRDTRGRSAHRDVNRGYAEPSKPRVVVVEPQLPRVCRMEVQGMRGEHQAYGESCLRAHGIDQRLPQSCGADVRLRGEWDRVYGANCLADAGQFGQQKRRR